jgi:hypothetical protein
MNAMTSRRAFLAISTRSLAVAVAACGGGGGTTPTEAQPPPVTPTFGTIARLGSQTLDQFLNDVRSRLPEGRDAANTRLKPPHGILPFCGATVWRNKYSLGIAGGHGDSHDDGHYAQDLVSGRWEMLLPPSSVASATAVADAFGEWLPGRPASQHSYHHLVSVGDDIVQGYGYAIANAAGGSPQAHRWNGIAGAWERYGNGGTLRPVPYTVIHDAGRRRLYRLPHLAAGVLESIPSNDPGATWTSIQTAAWPAIGIYCAIGYHAALDCLVMIDQKDAPGNAWIMDPANFAAGWRSVPVRGTMPAPVFSPGLEYVPPLQAFASANLAEPDALYFLQPTGAREQAWSWTREAFRGSAPAAAWEVTPGVPVAPQGRVKWSSLLNGLVMIKSALAPTEIFTPARLLPARG